MTRGDFEAYNKHPVVHSGDTLVRALQSQLVDEIIPFLLRSRGMMLRDNATFCFFDETT